jgi:hypothetical protein
MNHFIRRIDRLADNQARLKKRTDDYRRAR